MSREVPLNKMETLDRPKVINMTGRFSNSSFGGAGLNIVDDYSIT